jgi:hypothetical protein
MEFLKANEDYVICCHDAITIKEEKESKLVEKS